MHLGCGCRYRKDKYTPYGLMPGFTALQTAYDALSAHNARYGPGRVPVPEQLAGTMLRNVADHPADGVATVGPCMHAGGRDGDPGGK